ncbi:hypothetical protein HAX54_019867, partial [Datura stramonium]|nr:hypothetical protein [Datura stramonium]
FFPIKMMERIIATSYSAGDKFYIDPAKLVPLATSSNGGQDALSDSKDVETLLDYLKFHDVGKLHVQYVKDYAHGYFIIVTTTKDIVFNQIVTFFRVQH